MEKIVVSLVLHFSEISWSDQDCQEGIFDQLVDIPCGKCRRNFGDVHRIFIHCLLRMAHLWSHFVYETLQIHLDCCCVLNITVATPLQNWSKYNKGVFKQDMVYMNLEGNWSLATPLTGSWLRLYLLWKFFGSMGPNLNFSALTPNAGPTQTHAGCCWTPYD